MAQRRMFSNRITNSAKFLKMPLSSQALYFHLGLHADDDGIVEAFTIMRQVGAVEDDLRILAAKEFVVILNTDLVTFITDWSENNRIRADRKVDSIYKNMLLKILPEAEIIKPKPRADTGKPTGRPLDNQWTAQVRLGKDRLGKDSKTIDQVQKPNRDRVSHLENDFDKLWSLYPTGRKQGRKKAFAAYQRAIKNGTTNKQIQDGIVNYKKEIKIQKTPINYIKQGSTWFFNECWSDEFNFTPPTQKRNGREVVQKETLPDWAKEDHVEEEKPNDEDKSNRIAELMEQINKKE
ncbi:hypothetical protein LB941_00935 [Ligilactobacillus sp. WILCCON 0076]|uniref:Replisome organizer n=1 Tax=Ligilactobacillus ubinensis TaxID=2876789 RepID=A0A9X2JJZ9_9LACO|nr:hypothetical protein [Ligilactobacillus ubinensis]MCP0885898.1 hypothetical protein [Ligilactobacillus ubinensis]